MVEQAEADSREIEELLREFSEKCAARQLADRRFSRTLAAALFTALVLAPGCAAAAIFLMKDGALPTVVELEAEMPVVKAEHAAPLQPKISLINQLNTGEVENDSVVVAAALLTLRGRIEDAGIEAGDPWSLTSAAPVVRRKKPKAAVAYIPSPVYAVEPVAEESTPLSFLTKLFAPRQL